LRKAMIFVTTALVLTASLAFGQPAKQPLPADKAGTIPTPTGKIAFIREGSLWVMDWDGKNQYKIVTAENGIGKISWAPDGKSIAFCRHGMVDVKGPDNLGGRHKIYDIFLGFPDSAKSTTNWWMKITDGYGSRYPEFSNDGKKIIFTKDINANTVNATMPNYQTCTMGPTGEDFTILRKDHNMNSEYMSIMPTLGPDSMYAFVVYKGVNPVGIAVAPLSLSAINEESFKKNIKMISNGTAPAWSPDGKWLAYIINTVSDQGIYITNKNLTENYLVYKPQIGQTMQTYPLSWSPDSKWMTFALNDGSIWIVDLTGNGLRQITGPGQSESPAWSR